jgi:hypothetical protein
MICDKRLKTRSAVAARDNSQLQWSVPLSLLGRGLRLGVACCAAVRVAVVVAVVLTLLQEHCCL